MTSFPPSRWQQVVLCQLMEAFPCIQFIVTTHSPQVLTTVNRDHIRVLQATPTGFEARKPDFSPLAHESGDALTTLPAHAGHRVLRATCNVLCF